MTPWTALESDALESDALVLLKNKYKPLGAFFFYKPPLKNKYKTLGAFFFYGGEEK
jgi:hypothetical protein